VEPAGLSAISAINESILGPHLLPPHGPDPAPVADLNPAEDRTPSAINFLKRPFFIPLHWQMALRLSIISSLPVINQLGRL
jgi:hypothetical protein